MTQPGNNAPQGVPLDGFLNKRNSRPRKENPRPERNEVDDLPDVEVEHPRASRGTHIPQETPQRAPSRGEYVDTPRSSTESYREYSTPPAPQPTPSRQGYSQPPQEYSQPPREEYSSTPEREYHAPPPREEYSPPPQQRPLQPRFADSAPPAEEYRSNYANDSFEVDRTDVTYEDEQAGDYYDDTPVEEPVVSRRQKKGAKNPRKSRREKKNEKKDPQFSNFIDESSGQLVAFGGEKTRIDTKYYDRREDRQKKAAMYRIITLVLLAGIVGVGAFQIIRPKPSLSPDEVRAISAEERGDTGFPTEDGSAFAKDFVQTYLTFDENNPQNERALSYFYGGTPINGEGSRSDVERGFGGHAKQRIVTGPSVYKAEVITPYSARYTIGAVTQLADKSKQKNEDGTDAHLVFLSVSVYYNKGKNNFVVTPDSPTVVPPMAVGERDSLPEEDPIGDEVDLETVPEVSSLIPQFMKAYSQASDIDHSMIDQYVVDPNDPSVTQGLGGGMKLEGEEDLESAVEMQVYNENQDLSTLYVDVRVKWVIAGDENNGNGSATIPGRYVVTLEKRGERYLVKRVLPKYYISDLAAQEDANPGSTQDQ